MITSSKELREFELEALDRDHSDPLREFRQEFIFPIDEKGEPKTYLCGNSLGLQPKSFISKVDEFSQQWGNLGVKGHFKGDKPWQDIDDTVHPLMAQIVGAKSHEVVIMNALTVNLHLMLTSFYRPKKDRFKILMEADAFPSDRYAVSSFVELLGRSPDETIVYYKSDNEGDLIDEDQLVDFIRRNGHEFALILLGNTNYYTGQFFDMKRIATVGHEAGCLVGFDCAHGAGNVPLNLHESNVDFAVWCTYKYLNSGPGNLGGVFVHERHGQDTSIKRLSGWWGASKTDRFAMRGAFTPLASASGWQLSNPPLVAFTGLTAALELHCKAGMDQLRTKSIRLTSFLESLISHLQHDKVTIITPNDERKRGAQLSLFFSSDSKSIYDGLLEKGIICDWREPNVIRVSPAPIYNSYMDVFHFVRTLNELMIAHS